MGISNPQPFQLHSRLGSNLTKLGSQLAWQAYLLVSNNGVTIESASLITSFDRLRFLGIRSSDGDQAEALEALRPSSEQVFQGVQIMSRLVDFAKSDI